MTRLAPKFQEKLSRREAFFRKDPNKVNVQSLTWLPYMAFATKTLENYIAQGCDYVAYCKAMDLDPLPVSYSTLTAYFANYFFRGNSSNSFASLSSRLKTFVTLVCHEKWIDVIDPEGYKAWLRARLALRKLDDSEITKAPPLTLAHLSLLQHLVAKDDIYDIQILTLWAFAHATLQRLGELVHGVARLENIGHFETPKGNFFAFFYLHRNRPKAHKAGKQAAYAMVSDKSNPFAYALMARFLSLVHGSPKPDDFLFPRMSKQGFIHRDSGLSKNAAVSGLRRLLTLAKVPSPGSYTGHSAR